MSCVVPADMKELNVYKITAKKFNRLFIMYNQLVKIVQQ